MGFSAPFLTSAADSGANYPTWGGWLVLCCMVQHGHGCMSVTQSPLGASFWSLSYDVEQCFTPPEKNKEENDVHPKLTT